MKRKCSCVFRAKFRSTKDNELLEDVFIIPGDISDFVWHDILQACLNHVDKSACLALDSLEFLCYGTNIDNE